MKTTVSGAVAAVVIASCALAGAGIGYAAAKQAPHQCVAVADDFVEGVTALSLSVVRPNSDIAASDVLSESELDTVEADYQHLKTAHAKFVDKCGPLLSDEQQARLDSAMTWLDERYAAVTEPNTRAGA